MTKRCCKLCWLQCLDHPIGISMHDIDDLQSIWQGSKCLSCRIPMKLGHPNPSLLAPILYSLCILVHKYPNCLCPMLPCHRGNCMGNRCCNRPLGLWPHDHANEVGTCCGSQLCIFCGVDAAYFNECFGPACLSV